MPALAASIDPASLLQAGIDPVVAVRELADWVAHAYANDATGTDPGRGRRIPAVTVSHPVPSTGRSTSARSKRSPTTASSPSGRRPAAPAAATFTSIVERLKRLG